MPVTNYIWDVATDSYLMETDENDATTAVYTNEPGQFGPVISQRRNGESHFFHHDALGSAVDVSDAAENGTDSYVYKAYGEILAATGSTINPFRWVGSLGYYHDPDLLQYYIRARHYDPVLARWLSVDPIGILAGDANLYRHVKNDPISRRDPSGLATQQSIGRGTCGVPMRTQGALMGVDRLMVQANYRGYRWQNPVRVVARGPGVKSTRGNPGSFHLSFSSLNDLTMKLGRLTRTGNCCVSALEIQSHGSSESADWGPSDLVTWLNGQTRGAHLRNVTMSFCHPCVIILTSCAAGLLAFPRDRGRPERGV